jgi:hypothetical protein
MAIRRVDLVRITLQGIEIVHSPQPLSLQGIGLQVRGYMKNHNNMNPRGFMDYRSPPSG